MDFRLLLLAGDDSGLPTGSLRLLKLNLIMFYLNMMDYHYHIFFISVCAPGMTWDAFRTLRGIQG